MIGKSKNITRSSLRIASRFSKTLDSVRSKAASLKFKNQISDGCDGDDQIQCDNKEFTKQKLKYKVEERNVKETKNIKDNYRLNTNQKKKQKNRKGIMKQTLGKLQEKTKSELQNEQNETFSMISPIKYIPQINLKEQDDCISDKINNSKSANANKRSRTQQKQDLTINETNQLIHNYKWSALDPTVLNFDKQIKQVSFKGQQFLLVSHNPFSKFILYCGKCNKQFINKQLNQESLKKRNINFIKHCILQCEEIAHPNSSHFIMTKLDMAEAQQQMKKKVKINFWHKYKKSLRYYIPFFLKCDNIDIVGSYTRQDGKFDGLKKAILQKYLNKTEEEIYYQQCFQCGQYFHMTRFAYHIQKYHNKFNSLIQIKLKAEIHRKYILNCNRLGQNQFWHCPCRQGVEFNWPEFVKHVIQIHKGITMPMIIQ